MKLTRRDLLEVAVAVVIIPKPEIGPGPGLRKVERQTLLGWEQVRMANLKKGDIFRLHAPEDPEAHLKPYRAISDGYWCDSHGKPTMQAMLDNTNAGVQAEPA